ncbi:MAG: RNA methyltransferase [Ignavibacteria bacterium]|nr:RNA methyltransferase [Ignavibacteria bacterium]
MYDIRTVQKLSYSELQTKHASNAAEIQANRFPITVVLQDIRSLYNVGSIFRSADAFRVARLILTGYTPQPPRKEISKTALGADEVVPWLYFPTALEAVAHLQKENIKVFALELAHGARNVSDVQFSELPLALVLGNEVTGVYPEVLEVCEGALQIPMYGIKHSLNVAVAAGIALFAVTQKILLEKD